MREVARTNGLVLEEPFKVFSASDGYLASYKSYDGYHFPADARYSAPNGSASVIIQAWVKPPEEKHEEEEETVNDDQNKEGDESAAAGEEKKKSKGKRPERVKIKVMNMDGDTIRSYSTKIDTGLNRLSWSMRRDGVRYPSRRAPRPNEGTPSGPRVLPGTYKMVFTFGDHKDSINVNVLQDPRLEMSMEDLKAKDVAYTEYYEIIGKATEGFNRLKDGKAMIKRVNGALVNAPDSLKKDISKLGKALQDSITILEDLYMTPENFKGIRRSDGTLRTTLYGASSYIGSSDGAPNQSARLMMDKAREETKKVLDQINTFFSTDFAEYQQKVEEVKYSLFKELEEIKLE